MNRFQRWTKQRKVKRLKNRARALLLANQRELDDADCGFAMRDMLAGGRLSRREAEIHRLVDEAKAIEKELEYDD